MIQWSRIGSVVSVSSRSIRIQLRAVLLDRLGSPTIPQIFMGGDSIGGATDLFEAYEQGHIGELLAEHDIQLREMPEDFDPRSLLPGWLHKRSPRDPD